MKSTLLGHLFPGLGVRSFADIGRLQLTLMAAVLSAFAGTAGLVLCTAVGWRLLHSACCLALVVVKL